MCGLVGILGPAFEGRSERLRAMMDAIAHRGPDGEGIYEDEHIALGHRRLAVFDVSDAAAQPMIHPRGGQVLAFNGAIYNHLELRHGLDEQTRSSGDTEVLLRLLSRDGEEALHGLNGMWAFAFWDPATRELLLSRDRMGVKPLYWRRWGEYLAFASEPRALLTLDAESPRMDVEALATFVVDRTLNQSTRTCFDGIYQMPPASVMRVSGTRPGRPGSPRIFWDPDAAPGRRAHDDLRDLLDEAVALRMRSDVSSGYLISGGLDSSSVLASAARAEHEEPIRAYTLRYDDERDESAMASAIVDHINRTAKGEGPGISLDYIEPSGRDLGAALDGLLDIQGEPFADGSMLAHYELMRAVSAEGHKVVVGGLGGDEALAGYIGPCSRALAADQIMAGHWRAATRTVGGGLRGLLSCLPHVPSVSIRNPLRRTVQSRLLRGWLRPGIMGHLHERYPPEGDAGRFHSYLRAGLRQWSLPGFTHYEDRNAMHFGLEARAPLLDFRIVEWGLAQGPEQLIEDGLGKMPLRRCMTGRLPDDVLWYRKKRGLPAPADVWMSENAAWVDEALSEAGVLEEWIDTGAVRRDFASAVGVGKPLSEVLGGARTDVLWRIVMAARWSDRFRVSA